MTCPRCGFESPPGFAFCGRCGAQLQMDSARLSSADVDYLRRYLPPLLADALHSDLPTPSPRLLDQCLKHVAGLAQATAAYLPADLVAELNRDPVPGRAGGRFLEGTLLFADISGFTAMSEKLSRAGREGAEEITAIVNRYLEVMIARLHAHYGQLMKFGGDALLGLFREPASAARAARAALDMQAAMSDFAQTQTSQGTFPLRMKVGLHRGRFFAAQLGDRESMEYALFGADVNATAAAESAAQAGQVLMDAATLAAAGPGARAIPSETAPGYFVVQAVDSAADAPPTQLTDPFLFSLSVDGLRRAARLLDTLTPYLPAGLLARLVHSAEALGFEGEHRLVGVLFANIHGLGDLADRLGPGQEATITAALNRYFLATAEALRAYGGVLNKIDLYDHGDKLVVLFGAPVAHEDDAERVTRAALLMQQKLEDEALRAAFAPLPDGLRQNIGVNFGNVFAGYVGARQRREYSVIGDEVNLAARLMSAAPSGQIVASQALQRKLHALFHFTPRGAIPLKGKSAPVPVFTLDGARSAAEAGPADDSLRAPIVGRDAEWERFTLAVQALRAGRGQIVSVIGEAGLGKTRLVDEVRQITQLADELQGTVSVRWAEGRCLSYTESVSYAPFQELVRRLIGAPAAPIAGTDEAAVWACLRETLAGVLPPDEAQADLPYLANFLNLRLDAEGQARVRYLDAEALQRRTFVALAGLIEALCRPPAPPLILVLEDIHWIDQASRALLEHLFASAGRAPLGLTLVYRPERGKACWQLREKAAREYAPLTTEIELSPLAEADTQSLLDQLIPGAQWPNEIHQLILGQTEGNPLYLEELLRVLIETGVLVHAADGAWRVTGALESLQVPDTLEGVMMTRLDRLDEPSRNMAQVASVIGRTFAGDVLAHVADSQAEAQLGPQLLRLQQHEIAQETPHATPPPRVYTFKHGLMQEVAYGSLLARVRRQVHRRIAEYLEARAGDEGLYPVIARHAFLGQDWARALRYQRLAGEQAQRLFANNEALDHFTKALQSAEALTDLDTRADCLRLHLALGELLTVTAKYDRAAEHLAEALRLAAEAVEGSDRADAEARACRWQARLNELRGDYAAAFDWIERGLKALEADTEKSSVAAQLHLTAGLIHARRGEREQAQARGLAASRIAQALDEVGVLASADLLLGLIHWQTGDTAAALDDYAGALALYEKAGDLAGQAKAENMLANALFKTGRWKEADAQYRRARTAFDQIGAAYNRALAENNLGGIALNQGRLEEAIAFYEQARQTLEQIGASPYVRGTVHMNLGAAFVRQGELTAAREHLLAGQALFAQTQSRDFLPELHRHLARAALAGNDLAGAQTEAEAALTSARELEMRGEEGCALRVLGEIALAQGRSEEAAARLAQSLELLTAVADDYELAHTRLALGRALGRLGRGAEALQALDQAAAVFARLEADLDRRAAEALRALLAEGSA